MTNEEILAYDLKRGAKPKYKTDGGKKNCYPG
jgi:hypothetical protein